MRERTHATPRIRLIWVFVIGQSRSLAAVAMSSARTMHATSKSQISSIYNHRLMWDGYCADASTGENNTAYFNLLLSSEATQGKASAVEDKRLPNH